MATSAPTTKITIEVDPEAAATYETSNEQDRLKIAELFRLSVNRFCKATPQQLVELLSTEDVSQTAVMSEAELAKFVHEEISAYRAGR